MQQVGAAIYFVDLRCTVSIAHMAHRVSFDQASTLVEPEQLDIRIVRQIHSFQVRTICNDQIVSSILRVAMNVFDGTTGAIPKAIGEYLFRYPLYSRKSGRTHNTKRAI